VALSFSKTGSKFIKSVRLFAEMQSVFGKDTQKYKTSSWKREKRKAYLVGDKLFL